MSVSVIASPIARQVVTALALGAMLFGSTPSSATLYVLVMDRQGISIAADSRHIVLERTTFRTRDGVEKVIPLGARLAFMSSGVTDINARTATINPALIISRLYTGFVRGQYGRSMHDLSRVYAATVTGHLNALTREERVAIAVLVGRMSERGHFLESIIAGLDSDGILKIETVDVYLSGEKTQDPSFDSSITESVAAELPRVILSGEVSIIRSAFEDVSAPLSQLPSFQLWAEAMKDGKRVDPMKSAEGLLNLAIEYSPAAQTRLGYPIFVYSLNPDTGLKRVRIVPRGKAVELPH
jgi:hypothetical protein